MSLHQNEKPLQELERRVEDRLHEWKVTKFTENRSLFSILQDRIERMRDQFRREEEAKMKDRKGSN